VAESYFEYPDKLRDDAIQPIVRGARVAVTPRLVAVEGKVLPPTTLADKIKFHQETNHKLQTVAPAAEPAPMSMLAAMQAAQKASKAADL
jgi:hypothetical protein